MEWYHYLLIAVAVLLVSVIAVVLVRTFLFKPQKTVVKDLNDLNLEVRLSKRFRKFNSKSTIFKLSDVKIK